MFFSYQKKVLKDRAVGLVFRWRSYKSDSFFHLIIAFLVTVIAFTLMLFWIDVIGIEKKAEAKKGKVNKIHFIASTHPQLESLPQLESPLPYRWDPELELEKDNFCKLNQLLTTVPVRELLLSKPSSYVTNITTPKLLSHSDYLPELPKRKRVESITLSNAKIKHSLKLSLNSESLRERISAEKFLTQVSVAEEMKGKSYHYIIIVSEKGEVIFCSSQDNIEFKVVENWLRSLIFLPQLGAETLCKVMVEVVN